MSRHPVTSDRILDALDDRIAVVDDQGVITAVNQAWRQFAIANHAGDENSWGVGASYFRPHPPDNEKDELAEAAYAGLRAMIAGERRTFQLDYPCNSTQDRWYCMRIHPVPGADDRFVVSHIDITARWRAEEQLRASEARFRFIAENTSDGIIAIENDTIVYASPAYLRIGGYTPSQLNIKKADILERIHPDDRERVSQVVDQAIANRKEHVRYSFRTRAADGRYVWREDHAHFLYTGGSGYSRAIVVCRDVTENRRAEQRTSALASVVESTDDIVVVKDLDLRVIATNLAFARASGHESVEALIGRTDAEIFGVAPETEPVKSYMADERRAQKLPRGEHILKEEPVVYPDGEVRVVLTKKYPIYDEAGRLIGTGNISRDITERKRFESERLGLERRRLAEKGESLTRMAGAVAHHFNNMLTAVLGNLELLSADLGSDAAARERLSEAQSAARRASEMGSMLLTYLGQAAGRRARLDLSALCAEEIETLRKDLPRGVRLETDLLVPGPVVEGVDSQVKQLLRAMVVNAAEAFKDSRGTVRVDVTESDSVEQARGRLFPMDGIRPNGRCACMTVADDGCGMTAETLERMFDPFFTDKLTGRGLGLPTSLGIVRSHRGVIAVSSEPGQGSTFRVLLPLSERRPLPQEQDRVAEAAELGGGTVLVVDDEEVVLTVACAMLRRLGFEPLATRDGFEAIKTLREQSGKIQLVLCDLTMPGLSGWQTLEGLRTVRSGIPVILASGYDEGRAMQGGSTEQPQAFLHKPYSLEALRKVIGRVLRKSCC